MKNHIPMNIHIWIPQNIKLLQTQEMNIEILLKVCLILKKVLVNFDTFAGKAGEMIGKGYDFITKNIFKSKRENKFEILENE